MPRCRGRRPALTICGVLLVLFAAGEPDGRPPPTGRHGVLAPVRVQAQARVDPEVAAGEKAANQVCGACHKVPPPDVLPRTMWRDNIARMFLMQSGQPAPRGPLGSAALMVDLPPAWRSAAQYYEARAPKSLPAPEPWPEPDDRIAFRRFELKPASGPPHPYISHVRFVDLGGDERLEVVATDMRHGSVLIGRPYDPDSQLSVAARLRNPAHARPVDLDGDDIVDLLVADLGSFRPSNEERGSVVWLRGSRAGDYQSMTLDGWPRVSDVQAADFDGDGRLDLAVAAFGWRTVGHFAILRNQTTDYDQPSFDPVKIEARTGVIHVPPVDLDGDKRPDVVALFAQEHETVTAFINKGPGIAFEPHTIYSAPHPNWGSSGIQVVDLDGDEDLDVLLTNGDMLDDGLLKPYHGLHWLENRGRYPFTAHGLALMPGVLRAQAADLDGDGDLDVVACAMVPLEDAVTRTLPAVVWLEQKRPGEFVRHTLKRGLPNHATLDLADYDGDGDIDIVIGHVPAIGSDSAWVEIWENRGRRNLTP